jgi:hypothetical protein
MARATIVVPTHDHHETLPMAVRTCLAQTVADIEVVIVGDGVTPETRAAAVRLASADARVRFLDLPKGDHHGERHRDLAVREASSDAIFYLCDDDLLLPRHVENLLALLPDADLVQCRNGYVDLSGGLVLFPTDLARPEAVAWHLRSPRRNAISITGTAHRRDAYLALDEGWVPTPPGEWPDHYMWKKLLAQPGFRGATHPEMTAVQLPTSAGRELVSQPERAAELQWWAERLAQEDAHDWLQHQVASVTPRQLDSLYRQFLDAEIDLTLLHEQRDRERQQHEGEQARQGAALEAARQALADSRAALESVLSSSSWRLTAPLRRLRAALRGSRP